MVDGRSTLHGRAVIKLSIAQSQGGGASFGISALDGRKGIRPHFRFTRIKVKSPTTRVRCEVCKRPSVTAECNLLSPQCED